MKKISFTILLLWQLAYSLSGQIINGQDTLHGNEWINFDQQYYKIMVAEDGIYEVDYQLLLAAGFPVAQVSGSQYQLFHNGKEVPIYTSTNNVFSDSDHFEFYGQKNRSQLDRFLFQNPEEEMLNPLYSLFTDTSAYFLTWTDTAMPARFVELENNLTNLPAKEEYYMERLVQEFHNQWAKEQNAQGVSVSNFTRSEGFASDLQNVSVFTLVPTHPYSDGSAANLHIRYSGNLKPHQQLITLENQELITDEFFGFQVRALDFPVDNALLDNPLELQFQGLTDNNDKQRISNIILTYPRRFVFDNANSFHFEVAGSSVSKYLEITDFDAGNASVLYNISGGTRQEVAFENGIVKINLQPSTADRKLVLINSDEGIKNVLSVAPVEFIDYTVTEAEFIFLTDPRLYDDGNGNNYVQEYVGYRSSQDGGGYDCMVIEVQQLYDQFGWGLNRHSLSIRNFAHFVKKEWESLRYFCVIGKGREYTSQRNGVSSNLFVPTFGVPGSDNLLLAGADQYTPVVPIGRIAASSSEDINTYLQKVKEFEASRRIPQQSIADRAWMKRILHLGGGNTAGEQSAIRNNLGSIETILEENKIGADVYSFYKTSSDPIQIPQTAQIFDLINNGVSVINFYGHSSSNSFDFSIDNPDNYENKGRYPLMVSLGCFSGNIHTGAPGVGERFVFFKDKGVVSYGAVSGQGYISSLWSFASEFYRLMGEELFGAGVGDILQATIENKLTGNFGVDLIRQQFNLLSDPSLRIFDYPGPDLLIDPASVSFLPSVVTASLDSVELNFDVVNIGTGVTDSVVVEISRQFPDGVRQSIAQMIIPAPKFKSSLKVKIATQGADGVGQNQIFIKVDATQELEEFPSPIAETNNDLVISGREGVELFIGDNSSVAIYPKEFAIVSDPDVELIGSTTDPLISQLRYIIEIDTSELFDSPLAVREEVMQAGGLIKWKPPVNWQDNTVYYWRISPDSISQNEGFKWAYASFIFLENSSPGWNQSHYYQYLKDDFFNMALPPSRNFRFIDDFKDFYLTNSLVSIDQPRIFINNTLSARYYGGTSAGVYVMWLDSINVIRVLNPVTGTGNNYGVPNSQNYPVYMFNTGYYNDTPGSRKDLMEFLTNGIPDNDYVLFYTVQVNESNNYSPEQWAADSAVYGQNLFQILENEGAQSIRELATKGPLPYIFAYKKGQGAIAEQIADSLQQKIDLYFSIPGFWDRGYVESKLIGPARAWDQLEWEVESEDTDTVFIELFGHNPVTLNDTLLLSADVSGITDLSWINAENHPYLKLRYKAKDSLLRSAANLIYWRVLYEDVPEFAVNPLVHYQFESDTLQQGEEIFLAVSFENLHDVDSDSLLIELNLIGQDNVRNGFHERMRGFTGKGIDTVLFRVSTERFAGKYDVELEINPDEDQLEYTHINNYLRTKTFISKDIRNPILEITFDGVKILNGDLVSASPEIMISLVDENQFLLLEDTSLFQMFLKYPEEESLTRITMNSEQVEFYPAVEGNTANRARIIYKPVFLKDGMYQLIVQSKDVTGNASGTFDYKINFEVVTATKLSSFLNYPNPFSTATRFVYTLTGSEPPPRVKIQIMTVAGRIVREINQDELGLLKVGTHQTDFVWDGTDEFGDQLANGVYLFRVVAHDNEGKEIELYETGADSFITKGYGKMVLIR